MYEKGRRKGTVRFKVGAGRGIRKAALAGDFNRWKPAAMRKQADGSFAVTVALAPGRYEYKFLIDGDWAHDADVPAAAINCYGTVNSVAVVE